MSIALLIRGELYIGPRRLSINHAVFGEKFRKVTFGLANGPRVGSPTVREGHTGKNPDRVHPNRSPGRAYRTTIEPALAYARASDTLRIPAGAGRSRVFKQSFIHLYAEGNRENVRLHRQLSVFHRHRAVRHLRPLRQPVIIESLGEFNRR